MWLIPHIVFDIYLNQTKYNTISVRTCSVPIACAAASHCQKQRDLELFSPYIYLNCVFIYCLLSFHILLNSIASLHPDFVIYTVTSSTIP